MPYLDDRYVIVSADNTNSPFACKSYIYDDSIYEEMQDRHKSLLCSYSISIKYEELNLPSLCRVHKLHIGPHKQGLTNAMIKHIVLISDHERPLLIYGFLRAMRMVLFIL